MYMYTNTPSLPTSTDEERIGQKRRKKLQHFSSFFNDGGGGAGMGSGFFKGAAGMNVHVHEYMYMCRCDSVQ